MRRETSKTNKTVLELSCGWEAPTSAKQVGVLHEKLVSFSVGKSELSKPHLQLFTRFILLTLITACSLYPHSNQSKIFSN